MKKVILSCLMLAGFLSASAQEEQKGTTEYVFAPHWYVQLQPVGVQHTIGEADFSDLLSYNVQAAIGRQFTPVIGARLALNAWQSKGGVKDHSEYNYKFNYFAPSIDLTFNLSNAIAGFNPNRVANFGVFVGAGVNFRSAGNDDVVSMAKPTNPYYNQWYDTDSKALFFGQAGVTVDFKVSDAVNVGLELNGNLLSDKYNFKNSSNPDSYINLLAGVKINLGKTYSTRFIPTPEPEIRYVEKVVEKVVEVPAAAPVVEPLRRDIFFQINKTVIRDSEAQKVKDIVDYLNAHQTAKVMITGYADAGTGNDRINDRLAAGRAAAVVKALKEQGIPEGRIGYDSKGSRVQPFADNDSNRVSICIAE